jgi:membrane-associated phospholipid phosphatase
VHYPGDIAAGAVIAAIAVLLVVTSYRMPAHYRNE